MVSRDRSSLLYVAFPDANTHTQADSSESIELGDEKTNCPSLTKSQPLLGICIAFRPCEEDSPLNADVVSGHLTNEALCRNSAKGYWNRM